MGQAYEFDGVLYETEGEFLDALAHAYKQGDSNYVVDTLEKYGPISVFAQRAPERQINIACALCCCRD